ncbi:antiviral reverse transcriptase Drt3b [Gilvimarinus chinensis]|uniref:antiviral reverse transcriptase Drt3b n=1 Tax=Gilvimarinus chinensis TaxID=396005 RepID=UPI0003613985|nr:antiviral reverse transcriptase Drt3b [Gilvimarinus chinensis]
MCSAKRLEFINNSEKALISDTFPEDVPIIFTNNGFYKNVRRVVSGEGEFYFPVVNSLLLEDEKHAWTIPFEYRINKLGGGVRNIALVHPASQCSYAKFLGKYSSLICYFCSQSPFSIRRPLSLHSGNESRTLKDELEIYRSSGLTSLFYDDFRYSVPYFSYGKKYKRIFKFIDSEEFLSLEEKFDSIVRVDVSKFFDSIYTHTISWSTKERDYAKKHVSRMSSYFGSEFDKLIAFSNYGETNGIPIGSEVSRIFAEVMMQGVDVNIVNKLNEKKLRHRRHYDIKRYVDDYFIFSNSVDVDAVKKVVIDELYKYKLNVNSDKTSSQSRPFFSSQSSVHLSTKEIIDRFFDDLLVRQYVVGYVEGEVSFPKTNLSNSIDKVCVRNINLFKKVCSDHDVSLGVVTKQILGAISKQIGALIEGRSSSDKNSGYDYRNVFLVLLRVAFYFYSIFPEVSSSNSLSNIVVLSIRFFDKHFKDQKESICLMVYRKSYSFLRDGCTIDQKYVDSHVSLEKINVFLAMAELGDDYVLPAEFVRKVFGEKKGYFEIISLLYYCREFPQYKEIVNDCQQRVDEMLIDASLIKKESRLAHLFLDVICCPYLSKEFRISLISRYRSAFTLPTLKSNKDKLEELNLFSSQYWFVNWGDEGQDILSVLAAKRLRGGYGS